MCYSAMVKQHAKELGIQFEARIDEALYDDIFSRRLSGEKIVINKAMEESFLKAPDTPIQKSIREKIIQWHESQTSQIEREIFVQRKRMEDARRILTVKKTKKAESDQRIASSKIEKYKSQLLKHADLNVIRESDYRIFPKQYVSMIALDEGGKKIVLPIRYHMRPCDKDESFDEKYDGCYNARFDSIERVPWWKNVLGKRHGIILVKKFYENVPTENYLKNYKLQSAEVQKKNIVLCFEPDNVEYMFIPMLWDVWTSSGQTLYSGAMITDEPAPEIAQAGHDRTPVFLKWDAIDTWLNAGDPKSAMLALKNRAYPHYSHKVWSAA